MAEGDNADRLGHRQRLRERFLKTEGEGMADYELLEMVLFQAMPRGDTKPIAKALLKRFGSFAEVISADAESLKETKGVGDAVVAALKVVRAASIRLIRDPVMDQPVFSSWQSLVDYLRADMAYDKTERFRVLFLDRRNKLIADEVQQKGTVDHTPVYPREVVKRALQLQASALIMVHNHPSGDPKPSRADIEMTREVAAAAAALGLALHDHVVVTKRDYVSFKTMGLI